MANAIGLIPVRETPYPRVPKRDTGQDRPQVERVLDGMCAFSTREKSEALIVDFDRAAGLNDFNNHALRDSLYDLVLGRQDPRVALDLLKVDYLSSSGVAILIGFNVPIQW